MNQFAFILAAGTFAAGTASWTAPRPVPLEVTSPTPHPGGNPPVRAAELPGAATTEAPATTSRTRALGLTGIRGIINRTTGDVIVTNHEWNPSYPFMRPVPVVVPTGVSVGWNVWIPWCTSQNDFSGDHYITVQVQGLGKLYYIWQSNENWQDRVRFYDQPWWRPSATPVPGASEVNGERILEIRPDGSLWLSRP